MVDDAAMDVGVGDQSLLADLRPSRFELRFDEHDGVTVWPEERRHPWEDPRERDERDIDRDEIDLTEISWEHHRLETPCVDPFERHDTSILPELPRQLTATDVESRDAARTALQECIGKASGRRADVERRPPVDDDAERVKGMRQLDPATTHVRVVGRNQGHAGIGCDRSSGLRGDDVVHAHLAG